MEILHILRIWASVLHLNGHFVLTPSLGLDSTLLEAGQEVLLRGGGEMGFNLCSQSIFLIQELLV
jgi:hypothetical protein